MVGGEGGGDWYELPGSMDWRWLLKLLLLLQPGGVPLENSSQNIVSGDDLLIIVLVSHDRLDFLDLDAVVLIVFTVDLFASVLTRDELDCDKGVEPIFVSPPQMSFDCLPFSF